jgi:hypothetical protein
MACGNARFVGRLDAADILGLATVPVRFAP